MTLYAWCSCRELRPGPFRVLRHEDGVLAGQAQHADGPLQPRLGGGPRPHLRLRWDGGQQRVGQSPQQLRGLRPQHATVSHHFVAPIPIRKKQNKTKHQNGNKMVLIVVDYLPVLRWRELCGMREARKNHGLVVVNNRIYAVGGQGAMGTVQRRALVQA